MDNNTPSAQPDGPSIPDGRVPPAAPPRHIGIAAPASGAVQQTAAPVPRRSRNPHGPVPANPSLGTIGAPALLELSAAYPMHTEQRRSVNLFLPDAQMLFHVLGICDQMMNATDRFLRSSPAWLPIVSQLYTAVLWNVMILRVYVNSGYGSHFAHFLDVLVSHLQINECMIPGPLVPFFQSLAAVNGPFDWIGDICPALPEFASLWIAASFHPTDNTVRQVPIPAIILDQLYHFATLPIPANQASSYTTFQWYRNVFSQGIGAQNIRHRLGPQLCGSLYTTQTQFDAARNFWSAALANNFTRTNAANDEFTNYAQLFGFESQAGIPQLNWFQHITIVMQKYSQYFNGSAPLKSVLPTGIGAVVVYGLPESNASTRNWLYPAAAGVEPFTTGRFDPRREIPANLGIRFRHADHELEEQAEQYAILTHTNIRWSANIVTQNALTQIDVGATHTGDYWQMMSYRFSPRISLRTQFAQLIASRYHQQAANRAS